MPVGYTDAAELADIIVEYLPKPEKRKALFNRLKLTRAYRWNQSFRLTIIRIMEDHKKRYEE